MIQFSKLRLNGFKSFVDRTELEIGPGLNGVVGPNGCGKSNLVEALRWVMGESSAKRMRGGGMEDVIFSGSGKRAARNIAEVSLLLDNTERTAPMAYNGADEVEVVRRIERDHGSNYKVNGKTVRARDVQMLFADTVTGSNSPALVSQGRVAEIINAKPLNRRLILEESAGISGLFARRHEAELRLKAADRNLLRVDDIHGSMDARLKDLKRQARQAARYKDIAGQIRQTDLLIAYLEWEKLRARADEQKTLFGEAETIVAEKLALVTQLTKTQTTQAADVQPLRDAEANIAARLQTKKLALQRLEDAQERRAETVKEMTSQLEQVQHDRAHEQQSQSESSAGLERTQTELAALLDKDKNAAEILEDAGKLKDSLETRTLQIDEEYTALMQGDAEAKARINALEQQIVQNKERLDVVVAREEKAKADLEHLKSKHSDADEINVLATQIAAYEERSEALSAQAEDLKAGRAAAAEDIQEARSALKVAETALSSIETEISMLESFLDSAQDGAFQTLLDSVQASAGFEKALSRALGDALMASLDESAPMRWVAFQRDVEAMPALPRGCMSLLPQVEAPEALRPALSQIGVIEDEAQGMSVAQSLLPGQSLVSRDGTYWRWDGLHIKAEASDRNAQHLEQKNKLQDLQAKRPALQEATDTAQKALDAAVGVHNTLQEQQEANGADMRVVQEEMRRDRSAHSALRERFARYDAQMSHLQEAIETAEEDLKTLNEVVRWDEERLAALHESASNMQGADLEQMKDALDEARGAYQEAVRAFDMAQQEARTRKARIQALSDEKVNFNNRSIRAGERLKELSAREQDLSRKLEKVSVTPQSFERDRDLLLDQISQLDRTRGEASEKLAGIERALAQTNQGLKEAESLLSQAREKRAAAQAMLAGIVEQQDVLKLSIVEQFELAPHEIKAHLSADADADADGDSYNLAQIRAQKEHLIRDREKMGAVNLRAEQEAQELEGEVTTLLNERNDLIAAIEELRGGIHKINKEARDRLQVAFEHVNAHFERLFVRLFGGGKAYLKLVDSDDPLNAGLEIFAQPPGKALQSLSLLSGGEQALTSIALIFGMFLTNPSPICVLDEIDAPLDDANVDRLCAMLEMISARGETRFIVVTHHRMTMARMNRLYGVTMSERGVSTLVSVDLQQSFGFLDDNNGAAQAA